MRRPVSVLSALALSLGLATAGLAPAATAAPVPVVPAAPHEQVLGSVEGLARNGAAASTGTGNGPAVHTGTGYGPHRYVALGDSFASVGRLAPATWMDGPTPCVRTADAYPAVVARDLGARTFVNATCGGAVVDDLAAPGQWGTPPQLDALTPDTDLVTLQIGGNDVGFAAVVSACTLRPRAERAGLLPVVDPLFHRLFEDFDPTTGCADVIDRQAAAALDALGPRLDTVYREIARRAPHAKVVTVGYLAALPDEQTLLAAPACTQLAAPGGERNRIRDFQSTINDVVRAAAERNGATVVIPDEPGHSVCAPAHERWVDLTGIETGAVPIHPTTLGHAHVANRVMGALR